MIVNIYPTINLCFQQKKEHIRACIILMQRAFIYKMRCWFGLLGRNGPPDRHWNIYSIPFYHVFGSGVRLVCLSQMFDLCSRAPNKWFFQRVEIP